MNRLKIFVLFFVFFFINTSSLFSDVIFIKSEVPVYNLSSQMEIFIDATRNLEFSEILSKENEKQFIKSEKERPNFGISYSNFWIKIELKNADRIPVERILEYNYPLIDYLTFYINNDQGGFEKIQTGDMTPFSTRPVEHQNFLFPIRLNPGETKTIFFLIQSKGSIQIPILLWEKMAFIQDNHIKQILLGLYYGILIVMIFYNLFLYVGIKDISYLYYVFYILGYLMFQSNYNGYLFEFILPNSPFLVNTLVPFSIGLTFFFASLFTRNFLQTKIHSPRIDKLLLFVVFVESIVMILSPILDYKTVVSIGTGSTIPFAISIIIATIISLKSGYRPARYFALAWAAFLLGMTALSLKQFGFLPNNLFTTYAIQIGSVIEVTLLSLGLGDRINLLIQEKKQTDLESIQLLQKTKAIQDELNNARKIQQTLMPINIPKIANIQIALSYLPASQVGGDLCGIYENTNKSLGIYIGDVSGHGIPSALISLLVKQEFDYFSRKYTSPRDTLIKVNKAVYERLAGEFVTYFYGIIEGDKLIFSNAGHNPPILYRAATKDLIELKTKGKPLGIVPENKIGESEIPFLPGDRLILFTDGLTEAGDPESFGDLRFQNFILQNRNLSANEFKEKLIQTVSQFTKSETFSDDLAILVIDK